MRIIIAGGRVEADFVINALVKSHHTLTIINPDLSYAEYLSTKYDVAVFAGDPTKIYVLEDAEIHKSDIFLALSDDDTDNYTMCQAAKNLFKVERVIAIVRNPNNVFVFKELGIDRVINATNLLVMNIENDTNINQITRQLSLNDDQVVVLEITVDTQPLILNKKILDIEFPTNINISLIIRDGKHIVPRGSNVILEHDKLIVITTSDEKAKVLSFFEKRS
jgi:trk system potassium uptake protein TrkA